jgi:hypothetical protein
MGLKNEIFTRSHKHVRIFPFNWFFRQNVSDLSLKPKNHVEKVLEHARCGAS